MEDSYLKEFNAVVESVKDDKYIVFDKTAFYPEGGGQPCDTGFLIRENESFPVIFVGKFNGVISHEVSKAGLKQGDEITGKIDWQRRHLLMRNHTAAHVISGLIHKETGARITGGSLGIDKSRIDFDLEVFDRKKLNDYFDMANELIQKDLPIKIYNISREDAEKTEGISKLAIGLPVGVKKIRIVDIVGFDRQADGGCHVKSLKEIGRIEFLKAENKGKDNRRVYFRVCD